MRLNLNSRAVQRVPLDWLHLPALPIKAHPKKQIEKTKKFVGEFGQIPLIYSGPHGEILLGEEIWLALKERGETEADAVIINGQSPAELKAISLALHRIPADAQWIEQNVRLVLEELGSVEIDLDLTGFDAPEIDSYLKLDLPTANVEESGADIPPLEPTAITVPGMIWLLGDAHKIGCGSATDPVFARRVLEGTTAAMCFADSPYNLTVKSIGGKGRHQHREFVQGSGEMSDGEYAGFTRDWLAVVQACCKSTALIYSCIDWRHLMVMTMAGHACGMDLYQIITWVKNNAGMGGIYRNQSEFICVFRAGKDQPLDNVELGRRGRNRSNVWNYPAMSSFGRDRGLLGLHPTVKPVAMIADAIRDVTKRGDIVMDCFLGSGSSLMAAEETGRVCCGIELDPRYCDVAIRRWQQVTGREAVLLDTGEPFSALAQRRLAAPAEISDEH